MINLVSTLLAIYGLLLVKKMFNVPLASFQLMGKFASFQLVLLVSSITNLVMAIVVRAGALPCTEIFSSDARGEGKIYISYRVF